MASIPDLRSVSANLVQLSGGRRQAGVLASGLVFRDILANLQLSGNIDDVRSHECLKRFKSEMVNIDRHRLRYKNVIRLIENNTIELKKIIFFKDDL